MHPFSDNIVFYDTEFSTLDPYQGEILSMGLVKLDGQELYLELEYDGPYSDWVKDNILEDLKGSKLSRAEAVKRVKAFVGRSKPYMVADVNAYDAVYTYKLFGVDNQPFYWMPIDFASILFARGIDPERYISRDKDFFDQLGVDCTKYDQHNALDDAKILRETYLKFMR